MKNELLRNEIVSAIEREVGESGKVVCGEVCKNNGLILHGITILRNNGTNISPTLYLEYYIDDFDDDDLDEEFVNVTAKKIVSDYEEVESKAVVLDFDLNDIMKYDMVKDKLSIRFVNYDKNKEILKNMPHRRFLDLAIIYSIDVNIEGEGSGSIKLNKDMFRNYGITEDELFEKAKENTIRMYEVSGRDMKEVVAEIYFGFGGGQEHKGLDTCESDMYVLSNVPKSNGSVAILYNGVLEKISEMMNDDLIIFPSSIHEVIIIPYRTLENLEYFKDMVREINDTQVSQDEILSYSVYKYRKDMNEIGILE